MSCLASSCEWRRGQCQSLRHAADNEAVRDASLCSSACPPLWRPTGGMCYRGVGERLRWTDAQLRCDELHPDSDLATVASGEQLRGA